MDPSSGPSSGAPRPEFGDANAPPEPLAEPLAEPVADPAVTSPTGVMSTAHLARFEFSDAGTKILMVEWVPDAAGAAAAAAAATTTGGGTAASPIQVPSKPAADSAQTTTSSAPSKGVAATSDPNSGSGPGSGRLGSLTGAEAAPWEVSWPGKSTFLPARDADLDVSATESPEAAEERRRVFFLLPPDAPVPATVTITPPGRTSIEVKPLPAIFPEGFQGEVDFPGSRGVLHTIWAKKRVRELEREMDAEMRANAESVGLEMALAEKQWILDNFLRPPQPSPLKTSLGSSEAITPISPRSPITGRLGEKLKGLKLATSAADLAPSPTGTTFPFRPPVVLSPIWVKNMSY